MHNTEQQPDKYRNHAQVWQLLPWYLNGSLSAEEKQRISEHATVCLLCRKELGLQTALRDAVRNHELDELMMAASFDRLSARLHEEEAGLQHATEDSQTSRAGSAGKFAGALQRWLQRQFPARHLLAALSVLAIVVILHGVTAELFLGNNSFRTLSDGRSEAQVTADLRLIFADGVTPSERDAILDSAGLSIRSGPDANGLYFVNADAPVSAGTLETTLEQLRGNEKIMFAEFAVNAADNDQRPAQP